MEFFYACTKMTGNIFITGNEHNICEIADPDLLHGTIKFLGTGGSVLIDAAVTGDFHIEVQSGARIHINSTCSLKSLRVYLMAEGAILTIGANCGFTGMSYFLMHEPGIISIGEQCLFAGGVWVSNSDMHSILDLDSGKRINLASDIEIGDHVWLADNVRIHKGVIIGSDSIVGANSVVTNDIPKNTLSAGIPARVIRNNVTWDGRLL